MVLPVIVCLLLGVAMLVHLDALFITAFGGGVYANLQSVKPSSVPHSDCVQGSVKPPAGICPVPVAGIENVDLSEHIDGHQAYPKKMDAVLDVLGFG